jgi:mRNA interferase RelE/StbE
MTSPPRTYTVVIVRTAQRAIAQLPGAMRSRIVRAIDTLVSVPRPVGCAKLAGSANRYRIRVGDYRIIYDVRDGELIVLVVKVGHRRDVYR